MTYGNFSSIYYPNGADYTDHSFFNVDYLSNQALKREGRLNPAELEARDEAKRESVLGPRYWLRAHP